MHEGNFTRRIVDAVFSALAGHPEGRPTRIKVRVGETYHLEPDSVRVHYASLSRGTRLEGAVLELKETPMLLRCRRCRGAARAEDHHILVCFFCGSSEVDVLSGNEIVVEEIEMETDHVPEKRDH
jgi:hydrogenase nickel incorporation protein HypA/HybF